MYRLTALFVASLALTTDAQIKIGGLVHGSIGPRGKAAVEAWVAAVGDTDTAQAKFVDYVQADVADHLSELMDWGMNVLMTPYGSTDTIATLNAVPENTEMPILIWGGASDSIFASDGPCQTRNLNCFGGFTTASQYMAPSLKAVVEEFGALSVYAITNNNGFSNSVTDGAKTFIADQDNKLSLVGDESISVKSAPLTDDDVAKVRAAIAAKPDVFMISGHAGDVEQVIGLIKEGFTGMYAPKAIISTNGLTTPSNYDPPTGIEGVIMPDQWFDTSPMVDSIIGWNSANFKSAMETAGQPGSYHAASAGALAVMLSHAMKLMSDESVTFSAANLAALLHALPATDTFYGTMNWNADGSLKPLKPMYGKQHQVTAVQIVAPKDKATAEIMQLTPLTCGMVKVMYKEGGCCGNPSAIFKGRRLNVVRRLTSKMDKTGQLLDTIRSKMEMAGPQEAKRLGEKIMKVVNEMSPNAQVI